MTIRQKNNGGRRYILNVIRKFGIINYNIWIWWCSERAIYELEKSCGKKLNN